MGSRYQSHIIKQFIHQTSILIFPIVLSKMNSLLLPKYFINLYYFLTKTVYMIIVITQSL